MKRLLNAAFVVVALLIATATAVRPHAARELAAATAPKPTPEIRKPVRYEAIIANWKRYRSAAKSSG
jgi:hypothetical protein